MYLGLAYEWIKHIRARECAIAAAAVRVCVAPWNIRSGQFRHNKLMALENI